jgi:hypothetical protein
MLRGELPIFITSCSIGNVAMCEQLLNDCSEEQKKMLLETRYTILRLTAIYFVVIGYVTTVLVGTRQTEQRSQDYVKLFNLLLSHGARVDARDLCGKTVLHYAIGPLCREGVYFSILVCFLLLLPYTIIVIIIIIISYHIISYLFISLLL